jgi:ketosteroid isomerase-like protein
MNKLVSNFIENANAFDVNGMLALFSADSVIDDVSVGDAFVGTAGVRRYLEQYFVGYHTTTRLLALEQKDDATASARVDFTGDFGHETGWLRFKLDADGLIERIDAELA